MCCESSYTDTIILDKSYYLVKHFPDFPLWEYSIASFTLESGINIRVSLLIFEGFSRGYVLIKGGYVY